MSSLIGLTTVKNYKVLVFNKLTKNRELQIEFILD